MALWRKWLTGVSLFTALLGAALTLWVVIPGGGESFAALLDLLWVGARPDGALTATGVLLMGIGGGVLAGFGALSLALARAGVFEREPAARHGMILGLGLWFVLDGTASLVSGAAFNVVGNTAFLLAFLPPLLALGRREAQRPAQAATP